MDLKCKVIYYNAESIAHLYPVYVCALDNFKSLPLVIHLHVLLCNVTRFAE